MDNTIGFPNTYPIYPLDSAIQCLNNRALNLQLPAYLRTTLARVPAQVGFVSTVPKTCKSLKEITQTINTENEAFYMVRNFNTKFLGSRGREVLHQIAPNDFNIPARRHFVGVYFM